MFQEAFQKRIIIISCLIMAVAGFAAGAQVKSLRGEKLKSSNVIISAVPVKHS